MSVLHEGLEHLARAGTPITWVGLVPRVLYLEPRPGSRTSSTTKMPGDTRARHPNNRATAARLRSWVGLVPKVLHLEPGMGSCTSKGPSRKSARRPPGPRTARAALVGWAGWRSRHPAQVDTVELSDAPRILNLEPGERSRTPCSPSIKVPHSRLAMTRTHKQSRQNATQTNTGVREGLVP